MANCWLTYDNAGTHFHFTDWLGTMRAQVNANGTVEETCLSLPFGDSLSCAGPGSDATEHHFTGKERDQESGLDYFGARYFQSNAGRWMSPDWAAKAEPIPYAKMGNPQSFNLYGYVENNPLTMADQDGHDGKGGNGEDANGDKVDGDPNVEKEVAQQLAAQKATAEKAQPAPAQQQNLPAPDANHNHTLVVRQVAGQGGNPAGHVTVQVDGGAEVGFGPISTLAGATDRSTPGQIETRNPNVPTVDAATINLTGAQADAARAYIADRTKNPGNYQLVGNSCVTFGEQVMTHAGARTPDATLPSRLILDIRNQQIHDHTTQTPQ